MTGGAAYADPVTRSSARIALVAAVVVAATVIAAHNPTRVADPPEAPVPDLADDIPPERYAAWPQFVLTWTVNGSPGGATSAVAPGFGADPCGPLGVPRCIVRLAWHDISRWSLASSLDAGGAFAPAALQVSTGGLHYALDRGVVVSVVDTDRLPGLHFCQRLAEARASGEPVETEPAGGLAGGAWALRLGGVAAECSGPAGIPVRLTLDGTTWEPISLEQRPPTPGEIGDALVAGRAEVCLPPECGDAGRAVGLEAMAEAAGFRVSVQGAGVQVDVPWARRGRAAIAWATAGSEPLPDGLRRHRIADGFVVAEALRPRPAVTWLAGGMRVWLAFDDAGPAGGAERDVFVLGEALRRMVGVPATPVFAPGAGAASR